MQNKIFISGLKSYIIFKLEYQKHYNENILRVLEAKKRILEELKYNIKCQIPEIKKANKNIHPILKSQFEKYINRKKYISQCSKEYRGSQIVYNPEKDREYFRNVYLYVEDEYYSKKETIKIIKDDIIPNKNLQFRIYLNPISYDDVLAYLKNELDKIHLLLKNPPQLNMFSKYDIKQYKKGIYTQNIKRIFVSYYRYIHDSGFYQKNLFSDTQEKIKRFAHDRSIIDLSRKYCILHIENILKNDNIEARHIVKKLLN